MKTQKNVWQLNKCFNFSFFSESVAYIELFPEDNLYSFVNRAVHDHKNRWKYDLRF